MIRQIRIIVDRDNCCGRWLEAKIGDEK